MKTKELMKTMTEFKKHMTSPNAPNYVRRYCEDLNEEKWKWLHEQMNNALEVTDSTERLFYLLKWILKHDFDDLTYEIYLQDYMDPEMHPKSLIKNDWQKILHERYKDRLAEDLCPGIPATCEGVEFL